MQDYIDLWNIHSDSYLASITDYYKREWEVGDMFSSDGDMQYLGNINDLGNSLSTIQGEGIIITNPNGYINQIEQDLKNLK